MRNRQFAVGVFWSFLSAFLWATTYVVSSALMRGGAPKVGPEALSLIRFLLAGGLLFALCAWRDRRSLFSFTPRELGRIALLGQFSYVGMSVLLFWGQSYTTAINSSMIMTGAPVLTMLIGLAMHEKVTLKQGVGMVGGTVGCMMVIGVISPSGWTYSLGHFKGDGLVLLAALSWAISTVYAPKVLHPGKELAVTAWSMLSAAATLTVVVLCRGNAVVWPGDGRTWIAVLYIAVFTTALAFYAWNAALSRISMNIVNVMQYLTPICTVLLACLFLNESLSGPFKVTGIILVLGGVACFSEFKKVKK